MAGYTPPALTFWRPSPGSLFAGDVVSPVTTNLYAHAFGYAAGRANTTGTLSAFGHEAGRANTTGTMSAFGYAAGRANTTGTMSAFGHAAGRTNTTGTLSAFGHAAGYSNTTGTISAFGYEAGRNITENSGFCLFGHTAGRAMTVGSSNVTIIGDIVGEVGMTNTLILGTGSVTRFRYDESNGYQFPSASATAGTITPTHTVTLSFNGTKYKIPCVAA